MGFPVCTGFCTRTVHFKHMTRATERQFWMNMWQLLLLVTRASALVAGGSDKTM